MTLVLLKYHMDINTIHRLGKIPLPVLFDPYILKTHPFTPVHVASGGT